MNMFFARMLLTGMTAVILVAGTTHAAVSYDAIPTADAFVTTGPAPGFSLSGNNYGGAGALGVSGSSSAKGAFASVLKFDLATFKSTFDAAYGAGLWTVQSITLQLTATNPGNPIFNTQTAGQFSVVWMENDTWVEGTGNPGAPGGSGITYTSLPTFLGANDQSLGTFSSTAATSGSVIYTLTASSGMLADIYAGSLASLELLAADSNVSYLFNSRSFGTAGSRPKLTVTAVPEPAGWCMIAAGCALLVVFRMRRRRHAR